MVFKSKSNILGLAMPPCTTWVHIKSLIQKGEVISNGC